MKTLVLCLLLVPFAALAQNKCTMPDGSIIKTHFECPNAALKTEGPDGKITHHKPVEIKPPRAAPPPAAPAANQPARDIIDESHAICSRLKIAGATACEVKVNVFSESYIDATVATSPADAQRSCLIIANGTRQPGSPFNGRGWQLKLFSPLGSGTRPIAQCTL